MGRWYWCTNILPSNLQFFGWGTMNWLIKQYIPQMHFAGNARRKCAKSEVSFWPKSSCSWFLVWLAVPLRLQLCQSRALRFKFTVLYSTQLLITASSDLKHQLHLVLGYEHALGSRVGLGWGYGIGGAFTQVCLLGPSKGSRPKWHFGAWVSIESIKLFRSFNYFYLRHTLLFRE